MGLPLQRFPAVPNLRPGQALSSDQSSRLQELAPRPPAKAPPPLDDDTKEEQAGEEARPKAAEEARPSGSPPLHPPCHVCKHRVGLNPEGTHCRLCGVEAEVSLCGPPESRPDYMTCLYVDAQHGPVKEEDLPALNAGAGAASSSEAPPVAAGVPEVARPSVLAEVEPAPPSPTSDAEVEEVPPFAAPAEPAAKEEEPETPVLPAPEAAPPA